MIDDFARVLVGALVYSMIGCSSLDPEGDKFREEMDASIGIPLSQSPMHGYPDSIRSIGNGLDEYTYSSKKTGCRWMFTVDSQTRIIRSWSYVSEPEKCHLWVKLRGPW